MTGAPNRPNGRALEPNDSPTHALAPWFSDFRRDRERERLDEGVLSAGGGQRSAVLTIVQNESFFFPIWLRYYSQFFAAADIYVLDHESDDGSTEVGGFNRVRVSHDTFDNRWMVSMVEAKQRELLEDYDVVLVVDVDEIVAPDPRWGTLDHYLSRFNSRWVNCLGYEVLHMRDSEPVINRDLPILAQRSQWFPNPLYNKAAVATVPMSWQAGFHGRSDGKFKFDPDLRLIHLHRVDFEICKARHRRLTSKEWNPVDLERGLGTHNRVIGGDELDEWFYNDTALEGTALVREDIPADWRGVL
jgi:hypothetical protein